MDLRSYQAGAAATAPPAPASPSVGFPTAGTPGSVPATEPGPWWFHQQAEEARAILLAAGLTPSATVLNQLLTALQTLFAGKMTTITRSSGDAALLLDRFDVIHQYVTNGSNNCDVTTQMVDGGVYEVLINTQANGGAIAYDLDVRPNNTSYSGQFSVGVILTAAGNASTPNQGVSPYASFQSDTSSGTSGTDGSSRLTLFPSAGKNKRVLAQNADSYGTSIWSGTWSNQSTAWLTVGGVYFYSSGAVTNASLINSVISVRRIA
jgi:hypothetical protein